MRIASFLSSRMVGLVLVGVATLLGVRMPLRGLSQPGEVLSGWADIVDGDSLRLSGHDVRLQGLDAPELHQDCMREGRSYPCGRQARQALVALVRGTEMTCQVSERDRYGRALAQCTVNGRDIGAALVAGGHALAYGDYQSQETQARSARRGIWAGQFERPADWRRRHPRQED